MAKEIPLTKGDVAIVDDCDYGELMKYNWHSSRGKYAARTKRREGGKGLVYMHREIMKPGDSYVVDHINGDTFDNRRVNLRIVSFQQNLQNQGLRSDNTSGYKGVYLNRQGKWVSEITKDYKKIHLGVFDDKEDAARMYNFWATFLHGEYARLNEIGGYAQEVVACS